MGLEVNPKCKLIKLHHIKFTMTYVNIKNKIYKVINLQDIYVLHIIYIYNIYNILYIILYYIYYIYIYIYIYIGEQKVVGSIPTQT